MDNNFQEKEIDEQKRVKINNTKKYVREKLKKMHKIKQLKNGKRIVLKETYAFNDKPKNKAKRQPAGNKAVIAKNKPKVLQNKRIDNAQIKDQNPKPDNAGNEIDLQNQNQIIPPVNDQLDQQIEPVNNQIIVPEMNVNQKILPQNLPKEQPNDNQPEDNIRVVDIFMPPVFMMERQEQNEQPENNLQNNQDNDELVLEINGKAVNLGELGDIGIGQEENEEENAQAGNEVNEVKNVQEGNEVNEVENLQVDNEEQNGQNDNIQVNIENVEEGEQIAGAVAVELAQEENIPEPDLRTFTSGIYYVLTGVQKNYTNEEINELSTKGGGFRNIIQKRAVELLEADEKRQIEKRKKQNAVKEKVRMIDELQKDPQGKKRIKEFLKMDYSIFDNFSDYHIVFNFEKLNNAIEQAEYIEKEVLPVAKENGSLSEADSNKVTAMILAINDYKNYMNLRMMIIADFNYTLAFDEEPLSGEGDFEAIEARLERYTEKNKLSSLQLSTVMRYITYKTEKGNNPLFTIDLDLEESTMLDRMRTYGYGGGEEDEIDDEDIDREVDELINQQANENAVENIEQENANAEGNIEQGNAGAVFEIDELIDALEGKGPLDARDIKRAPEIPEVPEVLLPKRKKRLNYILTGNEEIPGDNGPVKVDNRQALFDIARKNYQEWLEFDPDLEMETAVNALNDLAAQGFVLPPELKPYVKKSLLPGTSVEAKQNNKEYVADAMVRGEKKDENILPLVLVTIFMQYDFSKFDSIEDENIVNNYIELRRMCNYGYSLYELIGKVLTEGTCYISQERADNMAAIISTLNEFTKYAKARMEVITSPYFALISEDMDIDNLDAKKIKERMPKEPEPGEEEELNSFINKLIGLAPLREKIKGKTFMERAKENEYVDVRDYPDNDEEKQAQFVRESEKMARDRAEFNSVQTVLGTGQKYDNARANNEFTEGAESRAVLSEKAKELLENINVEEPDLSLKELLDTDIGIFDTLATDEGLIDNFEEAFKLTFRWENIQNNFENEDELEELSIAEKQKLRGLKNMLCDAQRYMLEKLRQISNSCYKVMHTKDELINGELDKDAFSRLSGEFETDNAELMAYVNITGMLMQSPFVSKYAGSGMATLNSYISEEANIDDKVLFDNTSQRSDLKLAQNSVAFLLGGEEGLRNLDREEFVKGSSVRKQLSTKSRINFNSTLEKNKEKQEAITKAYEKVLEIKYAEFDIDTDIVNGIYPLIKTEDTEDALKFNMGLLMNLGASNINARGSFYKSMVDSFLAVDLSKFDRTDDDYLVNNFDELNNLGMQATVMSNEALVDTFEKNGYKISAQKKNNLLILAKCINKYIDFMRARMEIIKHPYYFLVFRDEDSNKEYDVDVLNERLDLAAERYEIPLKMFGKDLNIHAEDIAGKTAENKAYLQQLIKVLTSDFSLEERAKSMKERLADNGFLDIQRGDYDEDDNENEAYQKELESDNFIYESVALRKEMLVTNILKEIITGDGSMSLEDYNKQEEGSKERSDLINKARKLPDFDSVEPKILIMDILSDDNEVINKFLELDLAELDNLTDDKIVENYNEIAALCGVENEVAPALARLKEAEKIEDRPLATTVAAVEGRLNMLKDAREYVLARLSVISDIHYEKHYDVSFMNYDSDREGMEKKISEKGEELDEGGKEYLRKIAIAKSSPFLSNYSGSGRDISSAYESKQENDYYRNAEFKGQGENIEYRDENGKPEGVEEGANVQNAPKTLETASLVSKSMGEPLKELKDIYGNIGQYRKRSYIDVEHNEPILDKDGKQAYNIFKRPKVKKIKEKVFNSAMEDVSDSIMQDLKPVLEQVEIFMNSLGTEFHYQNDNLFDEELALILNHIEVLDLICAQYLTGRGNHISGEMEQAVRRKVRRIRNIAEYAYTQTYASARMSRIYFRQQDFSGRRITWENIYYYAEQPIVWEQGLVPYNEINKEEKDVIKGVKPPRTRLKVFTDKDNSFDKVEHWMKIFSECKPDEAVALDRDLSIKDMERIEKLVKTTNTRASQSLPDDAEDFLRACNDMIHSYGVTKGRIMKYINGMKLETDDDKTQKEMLSNVAACFEGHIIIYDLFKDRISDVYESIKNDPEIRNISDVFRSWFKYEKELQNRAARALVNGQAAKVYAGEGTENNK